MLIFLLSIAPPSWCDGIYPSSVKKLPSIELGRSVLLLLPKKTYWDYLPWDWLSEGPVEWLDEGYVSNTGYSVAPCKYHRRGLMRINVLGKKSTILKKRKQELAWQVTYCNAGNPGFGVNAILLQPGTPDEKCFFSNTNGCNLDPIPSLKASGFSVKRVCGGGAVNGYKLTHPERKTTYVNINYDFGSGGESIYFILWMKISRNTAEGLCDQ